MLLQLKITEYDGEPLTQEDRREMVYLSVTQKKSWKWEVKSEAEPRTSAMPHSSNTTDWLFEENMPEEMKLPISPEGEVHLSIPISERTRSLTVDVRCCPAVVLVQEWFWSSNVVTGLTDRRKLELRNCDSFLVKSYIYSFFSF